MTDEDRRRSEERDVSAVVPATIPDVPRGPVNAEDRPVKMGWLGASVVVKQI